MSGQSVRCYIVTESSNPIASIAGSNGDDNHHSSTSCCCVRQPGCRAGSCRHLGRTSCHCPLTGQLLWHHIYDLRTVGCNVARPLSVDERRSAQQCGVACSLAVRHFDSPPGYCSCDVCCSRLRRYGCRAGPWSRTGRITASLTSSAPTDDLLMAVRWQMRLTRRTRVRPLWHPRTGRSMVCILVWTDAWREPSSAASCIVSSNRTTLCVRPPLCICGCARLCVCGRTTWLCTTVCAACVFVCLCDCAQRVNVMSVV